MLVSSPVSTNFLFLKLLCNMDLLTCEHTVSMVSSNIHFPYIRVGAKSVRASPNSENNAMTKECRRKYE